MGDKSVGLRRRRFKQGQQSFESLPGLLYLIDYRDYFTLSPITPNTSMNTREIGGPIMTQSYDSAFYDTFI